MGYKAKATNANWGSTVMGTQAESQAICGIAIGSRDTNDDTNRTIAGGFSSIALGSGAQTSLGNYGVAVGVDTRTTGNDAVAIGRGATSQANQFTIGPYQTICRYYDGDGWANLSDERAKNDIQPLEDNCLDFIRKLQVKRFEMKSHPGRKHIGFLAQDVHKLLTQEEKDTTKFVQYDKKEDQYYLAMQPIFIKNVKATQELCSILELLAHGVADAPDFATFKEFIAKNMSRFI